MVDHRLHTYRQAGAALWSCPEYRAHREQTLPKRYDGLPGEKLLCYSHTERLDCEVLQITRHLARAANSTVKSLLKAYPSEWYVLSDAGVGVRFPESIRYRADLPEFEYMIEVA